MRYFTRQWQSGNMSDEEAEQVVESYRLHIEQIIAELPPDLRRLAKDVALHDGLFKAVTVSPGNATIEVQLRCGDLQMGYYDLDIIYRRVRLVAPPLEELADLLNGKELEILYQEIDRTDDGFEHRLLLYPTGEMAIEFEDLGLRQVPVDSRSVGMEGCPVYRVI